MNIYHRLDDTHSICFENMTFFAFSQKFNIERYTNALGEIHWRAVDKDRALISFLGMIMFETKIELMYLSWVVEREMLG
jgi:hypothetical protein